MKNKGTCTVNEIYQKATVGPSIQAGTGNLTLDGGQDVFLQIPQADVGKT